MRRTLLRVLNAFRPGRADRDLERELAAHEALIADDLISRGMPPGDVRRIARRQLGRLDRIREDHREARSFRLLDDARHDARYAVRMLRRSPAVSAVVVGSLAIGIGANTLVFSLRESLLVRPLPVPRPSELVNVRELWPGSRPRSEAPTWEFTGLRDGSTRVATLAAIAVFDRSNVFLTAPDGTRTDGGRSRIAIVSGNYFPMLQLQAASGRGLTPDDDRVSGGHPVAVVSAAYWRSRLGRSPDGLGTTVTINRTPFTIVGVMPDRFTGDWVGRPVDVWVPAMMQGAVMIEAPEALTRPNDYWLRIVGRLHPGVSRTAAEAALQPVYQRVMREAAGPGAAPQALELLSRQRLELVPGANGFSPQRDAITGFTSTIAWAAALLLLVVGANVAGILLARSVSRQHEMALRLAIGADHLRLARQLLVEGLLLASIGGALGIPIAVWSTRALADALATAPVQMFWAASSWLSFDVTLSWRGLMMTAALSVLAGTVCGLAPLVRTRTTAFAPSLTVRADAAGAGSRLLMSRVLVVSQIALAIGIVVAAGLLLRSLGRLRSQPLGFERGNLVLAWTQPSSTGRQGQALRDLWREATARITALPNVAAAGAWNRHLFNGSIAVPGRALEHLRVDGRPPRLSMLPGSRTFVTPGLFAALGVPLLAGRDFTDRDTETTPPVVIISETMARAYFDNEDPIGRHVRLGSRPDPVEIVGVVRDFETGSPRGVGQRWMQTYFPYRSSEGSQLVMMCLVIRTKGDPGPVMVRVRETLQSVDPSLALLAVNTVDQQLDDLLARDRLLAGLVGIFGAISGLLACLGVYGLIVHVTARRTAEIGIRMALGATSRTVMTMVLRDGAVLAVCGVLAGLPAALIAGRLIGWQLFDVAPNDPLTIAAASATMVGVALIAAWLPARRAARANPLIALREG